MKSATFYKLMKEERSHKIGIFIAMIFSCLAALLFYVIDIQNVLLSKYNAKQIYDHFVDLSSPQEWTMVLVSIAAAVMGISAFSYLHKNKQIDFRHSLPIKRSKAFNVSLVNHFLMFLLPFLVLRILETILPFVFGMGSGQFLVNMIYGTGFYLLVFIAMYLTMVLSMLITGNTVVAVCGFGAINSYCPVILAGIMPTYGSMFFNTYFYNEPGLLNRLSPFSLVYMLDDDILFSPSFYVHLVVILAFLAVLYMACLLIFKVRRSERHNTALAFSWTAPVIRFLVVIPMALYCGYLLYITTMSSSLIWMFFGLIAGTWLIHGIMECIFRFDVKGLIAKPVQMILAGLISCLIVVGFMTDVFGYDKYVPDQKTLDYVTISSYDIGNGSHYDWTDTEDQDSVGQFRAEELNEIMPILGEMTEKSVGKESSVAADRIQEQIGIVNDSESSEHTIAFHVCYADKSGGATLRAYTLSLDEAEEILQKLWTKKAFIEHEFPILNANPAKMDNLTFEFADYENKVIWKEGQIAEFLKKYNEELRAMTYEEARDGIPVGSFSYEVTNTDNAGMTYINTDVYFILPTFEKTLAYLKGQGIDTDHAFRDMKNVKIHVNIYENEASGDYEITDSEAVSKYLDRLRFDNSYGEYAEFWFTPDHNMRMAYGNVYITYPINGVEQERSVAVDMKTFRELVEEVKKAN